MDIREMKLAAAGAILRDVIETLKWRDDGMPGNDFDRPIAALQQALNLIGEDT